ncbi:hypothetical protein ABW20_dc0106768 [Dactylellina cionopaga]|nr:hypothetical protein ABW20_dc0106768 [Dactylellina cionopaga]
MEETKYNGSVTLRRDPVSPYLRSTAMDDSFMKIRSSMSLSMVLNAPSRTPPDSQSQTSETFGFGSFDGTSDIPAAEEEEEIEEEEEEPEEEEEGVQEEEKPASPPQTPPQVRYKSHHELHQEMLKETIEKEMARFEQKQKEAKHVPATTAAAESRENAENAGIPTATRSPPKRRTSLRLSQTASPENKKPEVLRSETLPIAIKIEKPVEFQPKIIRLKFKEPSSFDQLKQVASNQLPVKRGRGRPRKIDPLTGEPVTKKVKKAQVFGDGPPVKRRKSVNGFVVKIKQEDIFPDGFSEIPIHIPARPTVSKKRKSVEEPTFNPHVDRKQKIVTTSEELPRPQKYEHSLGISNLGATCYINVVVQMLAHTEAIKDYFLAVDFSTTPPGSKGKPKEAPKPKSQCVRRTRASEKTAEVLFPKLKGKLAEEFGILIRELLFDEGDSKKNGVASDQFWTALRANLEKEDEPAMDPNLVQDAHEFLILILQALASESSSPVVDGHSIAQIIDSTFGGIHSTVFECNNCHEKTRHEDKCMELEVPICKTMPVHGRLEESDLEEHLRNYTLPEQKEWAPDSYISAEGEKRKACPKCGVDSGRSMRHNIKPKGDNVCIELKRFLWEGGENRKVRGHVSFPMRDLDLGICGGDDGTTSIPRDVVNEGESTAVVVAGAHPTLYDLYGVVVHKGDRSTTGHYISYAKDNGKWLRFDDLKVHVVTEEEVARQEAYILMYEKKTVV